MKALVVTAALFTLAAAVLGLTLLDRVAEFNPSCHELFWTVTFFYTMTAVCAGVMAVLFRREFAHKYK